MLYIERRNKIMELLKRNGNVKVTDLVQSFHVDATTIRRDLKALSEMENVKIIYGGAYYSNEATEGIIEIDLDEKRRLNIEKKRIIAKKAAKLIQNGDTIILNNGVTAELILEYLEGIELLNVITQSLTIAAKAIEKKYINLYLMGGKYRRMSGMFYGNFAVDMIKELSANKIFLGVLGASINDGITLPAIEEIPVMRALLEISQKKYLIADSSKFGKTSLGKVVSLDAFDAFIVDEELPDLYYEYAQEHGIEII